MTTQRIRVAVIVDLVGSRRHRDRALAQSALLAALREVNSLVPADQPLQPTLGDECQARYATVTSAVTATLLLRLFLPESMDCRAGIGVGHVEDLGVGSIGPIQDGPGWWAARDAIVEAKAREVDRDHSLRTWYRLADDETAAVDRPIEDGLNAHFLVRDELISTMSPRSRRLLRGLLTGMSQAQMAEAEQISQSAVSQNLRRSGAIAVQSAHLQFVHGRESTAERRRWENIAGP